LVCFSDRNTGATFEAAHLAPLQLRESFIRLVERAVASVDVDDFSRAPLDPEFT
jgi:hypothetical protein